MIAGSAESAVHRGLQAGITAFDGGENQCGRKKLAENFWTAGGQAYPGFGRVGFSVHSSSNCGCLGND
jgi:hypothetical protein